MILPWRVPIAEIGYEGKDKVRNPCGQHGGRAGIDGKGREEFTDAAIKALNKDKNSTEFGIEPDHNVALKEADWLRGEDTIIEFVRELLRK